MGDLNLRILFYVSCFFPQFVVHILLKLPYMHFLPCFAFPCLYMYCITFQPLCHSHDFPLIAYHLHYLFHVATTSYSAAYLPPSRFSHLPLYLLPLPLSPVLSSLPLSPLASPTPPLPAPTCTSARLPTKMC